MGMGRGVHDLWCSRRVQRADPTSMYNRERDTGDTNNKIWQNSQPTPISVVSLNPSSPARGHACRRIVSRVVHSF